MVKGVKGIDFQKIEKKWQKRWEQAGIFKVREGKDKKKKYYVLEMFPYPSSAGMHMGHIRNYAMGDAFARFKRMQGFNVLYPMGYDAFGLPAENAAIKNKTHPKKYTEQAIAGIKKNQKALGLSYDWSRELATCNPEYYKWNQWMFLQMLKKGLAYKKEAPVNWCPKCETVLANEQVEHGKCWRCESDVVTKNLKQWFLKITKYADRLLGNLEKLEWPDNIKIMQKNWISRKEWIDIDYKIDGTDERITVSTTRPDTNFGATFVVVAPEHPLLSKEKGFVPKKYREDVDRYIEYSKKKTDDERMDERRRKTGAFTGLYCINQLTGRKMPIFATDFVLMSVGTGAVVGVPGHDIRDFEFAEEFDIPVVRVVVGSDGDKSHISSKEQVQEHEGKMINSSFLNGMNIHDATKVIMDHLEKKGWGKRTIRYRLRDWGISRQRYWGTPIPIIYCEKCGVVPVPEKDLPIILPTNVKFTGHGNPLAKLDKFVKVKCPKCGGAGRRETDTMDTFVDSNWYFLRYCSPKSKQMFDKKAVEYWLPVDQYIGGAEHAVMHLLYARFYTMVLKDLGLLKFDEPFKRLFNQGIVYMDGHKMSKSFGNVVTQEEIAKKYGTDTARLFLLFVASPDSQLEWSDEGIIGAYKFLHRLIKVVSDYKPKGRTGKLETRDKQIVAKLHSTIKKVTGNMEILGFNKSIGSMMGFSNALLKYSENPNVGVMRDCIERLLVMLSPFAPHTCEELWEMIGKNVGNDFISMQKWPAANEKLIDPKLDTMEQLVDQTSDDIKEIVKLVGKKPSQIYIYVSPLWKYEVYRTIIKSTGKAGKAGGKGIMQEVMKNPTIRKEGKSAVRFAERLAKETRLGKMLEHPDEFLALSSALPEFEKEFSCKVHIMKAEEKRNERSLKAEPGKPGIEIM
jgi:leucyl-tRNA synthetase